MVADTHMPGHLPYRGRPTLRAVAPSQPAGADRASWQKVVIEGLDERGYVTRWRGSDHVEFRCPAHEDHRPSGTADYDAAAGATLVCCHQGCAGEDILAAIGLDLKDLYDYPGQDGSRFPVRSGRPARKARADPARPAPKPAGKPECDHDMQPDGEHPYPAAAGQLVNTVRRSRCSKCGTKDIRPARAWPENKRILYRLPEVLAAVRDGETIWIHEGEKCADAAAALGAAATTNPFGSGKWLDSYTETLRGASLVVIVADHDAAGYRHALDVADRLKAAGIPHAVQRADVDQVKADIVDHLDAGGTLATLQDCDPGTELGRLERAALDALTRRLAALRAEGYTAAHADDLTAVMTKAGMDKPWIRAQLGAHPELADSGDDLYEILPAPKQLGLPAGVAIPRGQRIPVDPLDLPPDLSLLDARRYDPGDWPHIVPQLLPVGLVLVYGRPGVAKTTLSAQLEHCIATGMPVAGYAPENPGRVLVIDFEGGPMLAINQSLRIAPFGSLATDTAGDPDEMISVRTAWPGDSFDERFTELEKAMRDAAHEGRPYRLVRIDTMRMFQGPPPLGVNAYDWDANCLIKLNKLARDLGAAIVVVHHPNKTGEVSGSVGIEGSCTAAYRLERRAGESEGLLRCTKNRVGPERSWPVEFDLAAGGTWKFSEEITAAQAANTGVKRAIIDHLTEAGPSSGPDIRAALARFRDRTVRDMMTRLARDGWIWRTNDELWMLTPTPVPPPPPSEPKPAQAGDIPAPSAAAGGEAGQSPEPPVRGVGTCESCGTPMTILTPGQRFHPLCEPDPEPPQPTPDDPDPQPGPPAPGDGQPSPAPDPRPAPEPEPEPGPEPGPEPEPADDDPFADAEPAADTCEVCGEPRTVADTHPDCVPSNPGTSARWGGMDAMRKSFAASRMKPVPWIPPPGHKHARPGMQTRDMPQWRAAESTDAGAFAWKHPGLDDLDEDQLVLVIDRAMSYPSACSSVPVAPNVLRPVVINENPKDLKLAGIARVIVPEWDHPELPHPLGRKARPGEPLVIPSGSLEALWALHLEGLIDRPEVTGAFMGRRNSSLFENFYKEVTGARKEYEDDPDMTLAIKRASSVAVRLLYPKAAKSPWWRPDWYAALVGQAMLRHWIRARQAVAAGNILLGLGSVDEASFLIPRDADPATWIPAPYKAGSGPGQVKGKAITVRANADGLDQIDPGRITPHPGRGEDYLLIDGPVPVKIWRQRRG